MGPAHYRALPDQDPFYRATIYIFVRSPQTVRFSAL